MQFKPEKSKVFQKPVKRKRPAETTPRKARKVEENPEDQGSSYALGRRKSRRLQGQVCIWWGRGPPRRVMEVKVNTEDQGSSYAFGRR